VLGESTTQLPC